MLRWRVLSAGLTEYWRPFQVRGGLVVFMLVLVLLPLLYAELRVELEFDSVERPEDRSREGTYESISNGLMSRFHGRLLFPLTSIGFSFSIESFSGS